ncbi:hypothetical protein ABGB12_27135 [Actinocorallia sp. B10E7]|uniref:hypothetical protein n=1 Tax=Actinocorallia sp. B10E7 TaxID=3153558 RepID=UPI00325CD0F1
MGEQYHPNGSGVANDLSRHTGSSGPKSTWTSPRATGDIDVERERLNGIAKKLGDDLKKLEADIESFASANKIPAADLGISSAAGTLKTSSARTHNALLDAMVRLRFAYLGVINGLRGTSANYQNTEEEIAAYFRGLGV